MGLKKVIGTAILALSLTQKHDLVEQKDCVLWDKIDLDSRIVRIAEDHPHEGFFTRDASGFVLDNEYIVTAAHVIKKGTDECRALDEKEDIPPRDLWVQTLEGELLSIVEKVYEDNDLAVLRYNPVSLRDVPRIPVAELKRGDELVYHHIRRTQNEEKHYLQFERDLQTRNDLMIERIFAEKYFTFMGHVLSSKEYDIKTNEGLMNKAYQTSLLSRTGDSGSMVFVNDNGCLALGGVASSTRGSRYKRGSLEDFEAASGDSNTEDMIIGPAFIVSLEKYLPE